MLTQLRYSKMITSMRAENSLLDWITSEFEETFSEEMYEQRRNSMSLILRRE